MSDLRERVDAARAALDAGDDAVIEYLRGEKPCPFDCGRTIPDLPGSECCMVCGIAPHKRPRPEDRVGVAKPPRY